MRIHVVPPALLLVAALVLFTAGCLGGDDGDVGDGEEITTTITNDESNSPPEIEEDEAQGTSRDTTVILDPLSTFESKDPFVSQDVVVAATHGRSENTSGGDTTNDGGGSATATTGAGATTTTNPSDVANHLHSLRVLSIDVMNDIPLVTFEVDDTVYEDREEGDVEATSWGEVKVVAIDADGQTVTFLHGSETRVLGAGQEFLK